MVNNKHNVSAYDKVPPDITTTERLYINGPLYAREDVLKILRSGESAIIPWTRKCIRDIGNLAFDTQDIIDLLKQVMTHGHYVNSEWCVQKPTGPWAACDGYRLATNEWVDYAHKYMHFNYYVKFAIGKTNRILLLVSCHMSQ